MVMNNRQRAFHYSFFLRKSPLRGQSTRLYAMRIAGSSQRSKNSSAKTKTPYSTVWASRGIFNYSNGITGGLGATIPCTPPLQVAKASTLQETNDFYWNFCFDKGRIKNFVSWFLLNNGEHKTVALLDRLKTIGFSTATKAGISLGIDDLKIPPKKLSLLYQANMETQLANQKYKRGDVLEVERFQRLISSWHRVSEVLKTEVVRHFEQTNTLNPVYMMAFSGARGNISQVRQLVGMRGLMADPQGRIIDFPILSNFREGLTLTEYLISCYGARKGIVDTALRTANAGYLTRRLVDVAHHVIISIYDCGTLEGVALTPMKEGNKLIYSLQSRLIGRVLAENIIKDGKLIAERNQELTHDLASQIANAKTKVTIRSPLTCASKNLVCQLCYGWSLADGRLVSIGETVGIIAAQSIGEPGTQLTMRTFHTGGVFSSDVSDQIKAPYDGLVLFPEPILGTLVRTPEGDVVFLTKVAGEFMIQNINNEKQFTKYKIPAFTLLFSRHQQKVNMKALVAQITGVNQQTAQRDDAEQLLLSELEGQVFFASLRVRKYRKSDQSELKQNKLEVWTAPLAQPATPPNSSSSQSSTSEPASRKLELLRTLGGFPNEAKTLVNKNEPLVEESEKSLSYQPDTNSIGLIWLLSGKIYQYPTKTVSFLQMGDFVRSTTVLNELIWYTPGDALTTLPIPILPLVNTLTLSSKNPTKTPAKAKLINQQSGIHSIQYKNFGYLLKLNPSLFEKSSVINVSNYFLSLSSALIEDARSEYSSEAKVLDSIGTLVTRRGPLDTRPHGKEEEVSSRPLNKVFPRIQSKASFLDSRGTLKYSNEMRVSKNVSFVKDSLLHPTLMIYSRKTQSKSGGLFMFEDDLESLNRIKSKHIKPFVTQLQQYLFATLQETHDEKESRKKQLELFEFLQNDEHFFTSQVNAWFKKVYYLQKRVANKALLNVESNSAEKAFMLKQYVCHKKIGKIGSCTGTNKNSIRSGFTARSVKHFDQTVLTWCNNNPTLRLVNSKLTENRIPFTPTRISSKVRPLVNSSIHYVNPQSSGNLRHASPVERQKILWLPQEYYLLTGYYSNKTQSLFGLPSVDFRRYSQETNNRSARKGAQRVLYLYKGVAKHNLYSRELTNQLFLKSSNSAPPPYGREVPLVNSSSHYVNPLTSIRYVHPRVNSSIHNVTNPPYKEIWTPWVLLKTTFSVNSFNAWINSNNTNLLKALNRQGFSKNISCTTGLVRIQQKHSTWPSAFQVAKKGYSRRMKRKNMTQYSRVSTPLANSSIHFVTNPPYISRNDVFGLKVQQQTHHYQLDIRQGIVYLPTNSSEVYQLHNQILKPGISKIDDLDFSQHVLIECFASTSLFTQQTATLVDLVDPTTNIELSRFKWFISSPRTRYQPIVYSQAPFVNSSIHYVTNPPLLVLIRPSIQVQQENSTLQAKIVTELFKQSANNKLSTKVFNRLAYYTETYNKQVATGNSSDNVFLTKSRFAPNTPIVNSSIHYVNPLPYDRVTKVPLQIFKINQPKITMTSQHVSQFEQKQSGFENKSSRHAALDSSLKTYLQYTTIFENGECLMHLLATLKHNSIDINSPDSTSNFEKQVHNYVLFGNQSTDSHQYKESYIYYPVVNAPLQNIRFAQSARKLKQTLTQRLVTNSFAKNLKLKLQPQVNIYTSESFFNAIVLSQLSDYYGSVEARRALAEKIFTKFKQKKQYANGIFSINDSVIAASQPHLYISYLNQKLHKKTIVSDLRPWYVRGLFQYTLSGSESTQLDRRGEQSSRESNGNLFLRERKDTQPDLYLPLPYGRELRPFILRVSKDPQAFEITQAKLVQLKQLGLGAKSSLQSSILSSHSSRSSSIVTKLLSGAIVNLLQPAVFQKLVRSNFYFRTHQPMNFSPVHVTFTSQKYRASVNFVNTNPSSLTEKLTSSLQMSFRRSSEPASCKLELLRTSPTPFVNSSIHYVTNPPLVNSSIRTPHSFPYGRVSNASRQSSTLFSSSRRSTLLKYHLPGSVTFGFTSSIDSKMFLKSVKSQVSATQSFARLPRFSSGVTSLGYPFPIARTSCLSPFNGEILHSVQNPTKSQLLILTPKDMVALDLQKQKSSMPGDSRFKPIKRAVGQFIKFGDLLNSDDVTTETGSIIHISQDKLTLRRSQYIAASHKAVLHVKNNDWIEKNVPLVTLPFQRLKAGDIVQGIPKIEQYFEARKSKAGRFYKDSIPSLMNAIFNEYLTRYRLVPFGTTTAAKKAILKVQQILLNGIQRVYRTQGVSIADKHIEIIVRQMTSKVRILNPGVSSFLPGELVDVHLIVQLNRYLEQEIQFEPIVLGITQASLEVDSFISASSFQQTTRVLSEAALDKKRDYLRGLKENVILGNLMPAGTGHQIQQYTS
uniref:DNA-directed RNA polymerase subunit beta'' n=1 Tax=Hafniomonas laevis TaxID=436124 RepID=A0A0S2LPC7_9CHLO|nr:beta'' subunit of RNA polymerase [Hafniomonas laevis]ALO63066.1 beta'' subunit of RNA polymerase [Hafniomonas laevis]